ncbi:hypothetical protein Q6D67_16855 [Haliea sp. E1-2-M8]|uniref:hypothetical protein n=1 Tax=Haliea sp. E1-2-M8 TaxID=3064706 RepID=UPI00272433D7|nr:hypothetical protein [Haliea sp. E1-2-M8]MDO8863378.1 hypothetical protein [Haliea sp. E1-2-M8]
MPPPPVRLQRYAAATIVAVSGLLQIASLWRYRLSEDVLLTALIGSVYLLVAIGLYGRSRFTLFVAAGVSAACAGILLLSGLPWPWPAAQVLRFASDLAVVLLCGRVLWSVRHLPSI